MKKDQKMHVKVGDIVSITSGFHKTEIGEIIKINKKTGKVIVKGVNFKFKHIKPKNENEIGEIKKFEMPPMTMVFQVKDEAFLDKIKTGDKVNFVVEKMGGAFVLSEIQVSN